jgi:O-antigen ligase
VVDCVTRRRIHLQAPPIKILLIAYFGFVLISILASPELAVSAWYIKKLFKYLLIFLIYTYFRGWHVETGLRWTFVLLGASAGIGILEFLWLKDVDLMHRIGGFMSHWMTFSGQLMMGSLALAGYLLLVYRKERDLSPTWRALLLSIFPILLVALLLTYTRSAWIGLTGGMAVLLLIYRRSWAIPGFLLVVLGFLLAPASFQQRVYSSFDLTDITTRGRVELLKTGARIISEHPLTGIGPRRLHREAVKYRTENVLPDEAYEHHLHSNFVQIAAELGLPAALVWLAISIWLICDFIRIRRDPAASSFQQYLAVNGICVLVAFHLMGLLEYNLGDFEAVVLLVFFLTIPYVVQRESRRDPMTIEKLGSRKLPDS